MGTILKQYKSRHKRPSQGHQDLNRIFLKTPTRGDTFCVPVVTEKRPRGFSENMGRAPLQPPGVSELGTGSPGVGRNTLQASEPQAKS